MDESGRLTAVETTTSRYQLLGWLLVVENQSHQTASAQLELGLDCFTGNHGKLKVIHTRAGFGFGFRKPQTPLPLSHWSCFSDRDYICFVEGVFYEDYLSHSPPAYEDEQLARLLLTEYLAANARAFERLNGSFSGFIFDSTNKSLFTFVDRLSTRVLYWSHIDSNLIVSTNLGGFRPFKKLALDYVSAFQFLTVGFPVGERTLLEGIHLQRPCSVNVFNKQKQYSLCYWDLPKRAVKMSVRDAADLLASSMETFVTRVHARSREKLAFGLSGGHDSRVVLSALAYAGIPFEVINRWERNFNHRVALQLCSLVDKIPTVVRDFSDVEIAEMKDRAFDYSDGNVTHSLDFVYLARQCLESDLSCLLLGFAGDKISGSLTIPAPEYFETIEQLANTALGNQMELFSLSEARSLLKSADPSVIDATLSEWTQSFAREGRREYLTDICIWQALSNRNVRRIRFAMAPAMQYAQVLLPYLDNTVLESYFNLPIGLINKQKAHCNAGFYRFPKFGDYRAATYPFSLREEATYPLCLYVPRLTREKLRTSFRVVAPPPFKSALRVISQGPYAELSRCPLFDAGLLETLILKKRLKMRHVNKMDELRKFYEFYVSGSMAKI